MFLGSLQEQEVQINAKSARKWEKNNHNYSEPPLLRRFIQTAQCLEVITWEELGAEVLSNQESLFGLILHTNHRMWNDKGW